MSLFDRTIAFERELQTRLSTSLVEFAFGTAFLNDRYPLRWDSNFLWVDRTASAAELIDEADRVLGKAGVGHREIRVDDDTAGLELSSSLAAAGYDCNRIVVMQLDGAMDQPPSAPAVEEVDLGTLLPTLETILGREHPDSEETVRMLATFRHELVNHAGARFFCARVDGDIASACELYRDGPIAEIEDVNTLEEFRNRGLGRAVVRRAATEALVDGAQVVFLQALAADWPKDLYARLGFRPIGYFWSFAKPPAG